MNARDYIYDALNSSMLALRGDIEDLYSYIDMDFDDYFGASCQIVKDKNGIEVLCNSFNEYVADEVVCTAEDGREMFDDIRDEALAEILQDILDAKEESLDVIGEDEVEPDEDGIYYPKDENLTIIINDTPVDTFFYKSWMDEIGTFMLNYCDMEMYDVAKMLGCTHYFCDRWTKYNCGRWHETEYTTVFYKKESE